MPTANMNKAMLAQHGSCSALPGMPIVDSSHHRIDELVRRAVGLRVRKGLGIDIAVASFCIILIAVMWILALKHLDYERQEMVNSAIVANSNLAMAFEEHTIRTLRGIDQTLLFIRHEYARQGARLNIRSLVGNGLVKSDILLFIGVADERGNLVTASAEFRPTNLFDREYFQFHRQTDSNELSISKPLLGRVSGKWAIVFSHRINKPDGAFGGVVYAVVEPSYFNAFYEQVHLGEQGVAILVGLDGITRARRAGSAGTFGHDIRQSNLFTEQAKRRVGSFLSEGRRDDVPRFISYRTLGPYPLIVAVGTSQAEVLAPFRARARDYYLAASFGSALTLIATIGLLAALARHRRTAVARAHLASIVESSADAITSRTREGIITSWNDAAERMFGYTAAEAIGRHISIIIPPELREEADRVRAAITAGDLPVTRDTVCCTKDGRRIDVAITRSPIKNERGEMIGVSAIHHDITARKAAETSLLRAERQLRMAHEDREHLSRDLHDGTVQELYAIGLGLEEAQRHISLDPRAASARLSERIKNLNAVIRQLRKHIIDSEHSQLTGPHLHSDLAALANMAKSAQAPQFRVDIDAVAASRLSPGAMPHVLYIAREAMSNSLRHSGGHTGLVSLTSDHDKIRLLVKDDGVGFAAEQVRGRGNGLRNIEARVREIAGQLEVRAAPGHGTQIIVDIPAGDTHAA